MARPNFPPAMKCFDTASNIQQGAIVDGVVGDVKTKYSQSDLPLDPVPAEIRFAWKRASQFGGETDWVFASPPKPGELPLRATALQENHIKPTPKTAGLTNRVGWYTFRYAYSSTLGNLAWTSREVQSVLG
jgi:hypothetical protein